MNAICPTCKGERTIAARRVLRWPVYAFDRNGYRDLRVFHDMHEAADFVSAGMREGEANRYIGEPRYGFDDGPQTCAICSETLNEYGECEVGCEPKRSPAND